MKGARSRRSPLLPIPADAEILPAAVAAAVADEFAIRVRVVPRMRRAHGLPLRVVEFHRLRAGRIAAEKFPIEVEIERLARGRGRDERLALRVTVRDCGEQKDDGEDAELDWRIFHASEKMMRCGNPAPLQAARRKKQNPESQDAAPGFGKTLMLKPTTSTRLGSFPRPAPS